MTPCAEDAPLTSDRAGGPGAPQLVPCLLLRRGRVCVPGPEGPVVARRNSGAEYDVFDVIDQLNPRYPLLYLADLDGIERNDPQLDYIQELSRDMPLWVDSGVRQADQAIDVIVAGAQRAVLSSAYLAGPRELRRAWRISTELVFELETVDGRTEPIDAAWGTADPLAVAAAAREIGVAPLVLSPRGSEPDWRLVAQLATGGPVWVDGAFEPAERPRLADARAAGGIFHIDAVLRAMDEDASPTGS